MIKEHIEDYQFPEDLKHMNEHELTLLAVQIREFLIDHVSRTGGHLASNLGVVELTIALHRVLDSPKDKIIWDVGHQTYVHKILTGRADQFDTLRQTDGLSGFPKRRESEHDCYETGHSSTSLSAAHGFAKARDLKGEKHQVAAVIGDGSLTGGLAYEALNNIGAARTKMIIILNDNGMSISKNIGGMSRHLNKLRTSTRYLETKHDVKEMLDGMPLGPEVAAVLSTSKNWLKYVLMNGGIMFEEMGFTYLGPVEGHNIPALIRALEQAEKAERPVILHVITKKGKGYRIAEKNPDRFHSVGPFDPMTGVPLHDEDETFSSVMGKTALSLAKEDDRITAVCAAMGKAVGFAPFALTFPERYFDVGIAEQHAVTFAAGLAASGMRPLVAIYDSFLQRAYDQIIEDVCLQNLPVVFAMDRSGVVGPDGETHQGLYDMSSLRVIPNLEILTPADGRQLRAMMRYAFAKDGPTLIRYPKGSCTLSVDAAALAQDASFSAAADDVPAALETPAAQSGTEADDVQGGAEADDSGMENGTASDADHNAGKRGFGNLRLASGSGLDLFAEGTMLNTAASVRRLLAEHGIDAGLVCVRTVKPFDTSVIDPAVREIHTFEDGAEIGGFGEGLRAYVPEGVRVTTHGLPDEFIPHGAKEEIMRRYGLDAETLAERIREQFEGKA